MPGPNATTDQRGPEAGAPVPREDLGVVVVAAGRSRRMAGVDKIFTNVLDKPLIAHTIEALASSPLVGELVLVLSPDNVLLGRALARASGWSKLPPESVCAGGPRRQDSVRLGLERLSPCRWVAIHDGARPCIDAGTLERGFEAAMETGAAVAAVPAKDTIKVVPQGRRVESTPPRETLWLVQTPQVFRHDILREAHLACDDDVTDDASMVERLGHIVHVFMGSYANVKVTTQEDLDAAEVYLRKKAISDNA
jgi:2-C-methyl-D-erythritol 4-phosphate cytidylyltransferase